MKKFVKIFLFCLFVVGFLALVVCYIVIPNETKSAIDIVVDYANKPLFIAGGSTITIGVVLYCLIRVFAKYILNKNKEQLEEYKQKVVDLNDKAKDYAKIAEEHYAKLQAQLDTKDKQINYLVNVVEKVCETSPNVKIKAIGEQVKKGYEEYGKKTTNYETKEE